jgi:acyl-CoA synthetase (AMP-forming)/AMP-acid ligase II
VAAFLTESGAQPGDRVVISGENSLFWVSAYLGTMLAGLVAVPLPPEIAIDEWQHVLRTTGARFAFLQRSFAERCRPDFEDLRIVLEDEMEHLKAGYSANGLPSSRAAGDDLAALMFTSGSSGTPRGVMVTHRNIIANTASIVEYLGLTADDRIMAVLPFHYCFGASLLHTHLAVGGSLVVDNRFMYPEVVLRRMQETNCTGFAGVPSHYQILLRRSGLRQMTFPHLRYVQQAGGHLAPALARELREALPNSQVFLMYGQTEATARLSYLPPHLLDKKPGSIGCGIPGVTLKVLDESGVPVRPGEVGEIVAEGDNVTCGYWQAPEESAHYFRDGRLHTGDLATVDEEGFIYIVDRAKDFVKCGSKRVSCRQIEEHLLEFRDLVEAAVIGIPDDVLGEAVQAFVVPREPAAADHLEDRVLAFCAEHFPPHLRPRSVVCVSALPRNDSGKVLKRLLKLRQNQAAAFTQVSASSSH